MIAGRSRREARSWRVRARQASAQSNGGDNGQETRSQAGRCGPRRRRRPARPGLRSCSQLGPLRLGHGAAGQRPALPGSVSAVPARGGAPRLRGGDGHDALARGRAGLWDGPRHLRHRRLRGQHLPRRRHGEGDRGLRAATARPEALRSAHVARAPEAPGPSRPGPVLEDDPRDGEAVRQARRLPRDDERPRHRGAGPARLRSRQGADGSPARGRVEARPSSENLPGATLRPSLLPGRLP